MGMWKSVLNCVSPSLLGPHKHSNVKCVQVECGFLQTECLCWYVMFGQLLASIVAC